LKRFLIHPLRAVNAAVGFFADDTVELTTEFFAVAVQTSVAAVAFKTLRGGQAVETEGSVIVFGNVNPGAQITAGGSVDIRGTCRGVVHAGAAGDSTAFIIADHLMPTQIRIANYVARSPDEPEDSGKAERAYVRDGQIVIEPIER